MEVVGIIPARLQSTRLPRKLLLNATGKPLLQHTWEAVRQASLLDDVIIAADSPEIAEAATAFGARVMMTGEHPSGTDRIAEVARRCCEGASFIVNIQGDEPEIEPDHIDRVVEAIRQSGSEMATLGTRIDSVEDLLDPSCVKVVCSHSGQALYFSRAPIPFSRDQDPAELIPSDESPWLLHIGLYAYRFDYLLQLTQLEPSPLEQLEKLEQLRALEFGAAISVAVVNHRAVGIDTPDDYARFVSRQTLGEDSRRAG